MKGYKRIKTSGGIAEYRLVSNDLTVLLMEDHSAPVATFMTTYHVGSRNEATGHTGATHLLEHLMFKGSRDFNREQGNTIWSVLQNVGARINATTWLDRTNYYEVLPREHLKKAIEIESDRMRRAFIAESDHQPEMTVVRNEFERGENDPWETLDKNLWATAYHAHPYHHSTIGWRSDIEGVSTERLRQFYNTFYWPNNATITVIGDFETKQVLAWIQSYFGQHSSSEDPIPDMYTTEPKQEGPRRFIIRRTGETGIVAIAHKNPEGLHKDKYAFSVLRYILGIGKASRLYKALIDKGLAASIIVWDHPFHDNGLFITYAFLTPDTPHQTVEEIILDEYEQIKTKGVTLAELERAKAMIRAEIAFSRDGSYAIAGALNEAIALGDWTYYTTYLQHIIDVSADDIQRISQTYLVDDQSTTGWFEPIALEKAAGSSENSAASSRAVIPQTRQSI